ncbi:class I SAM-dependent DNA methyltransferase [Actinoalloteichus hymeniacidonis]|uniref:Methyltransferase domain n=1 Tax=Actinoalloteichus hymeniacidonis TaxID=340345 RepID=A0AAC9MXA4_9PSEU|nr:class I SAM-dependent methyltransferase [Actinoalloteichus hymeniacidonis]AOS61682.1 Methyltransferase domain [Actinoalloteichus hymeniacidonis]MBB5910303.1 ubiquinone/menaquinone biosynthesis C-methylase UbiE [Actinoalloteichus hymeniacidonis]
MPLADVRNAYGARADEYIDLVGTVEKLAEQDRDLILRWGKGIDGPVLDAGCGPGHWAHYLHEHGVHIEGVDMVPEFLARARERFPAVRFHEATLDSLPVESDALGGLLSWYSIIHTAPEEVPAILREFVRCLRPGGSLLLGFFEGERVEPFDHAVVPAYYWSVPAMKEVLASAGFEVTEVQTRTATGKRTHAAVVAVLRG